MTLGSNESPPSMDLSSFSSDASHATSGSGFSEQTFAVTNVDILSVVRSKHPPKLPLRMELKYDGFEVVRTKENTGFDESMRKLREARKALNTKVNKTVNEQESTPAQSALSYHTYAKAYLKERHRRKKLMSKKIEREHQLNLKPESQQDEINLEENSASGDDRTKVKKMKRCQNQFNEILLETNQSTSLRKTTHRGLEDGQQEKSIHVKTYQKTRKSKSKQKVRKSRSEINRSSKQNMSQVMHGDICDMADNRDRIEEQKPTPPFKWFGELPLVPFFKSACSCKENVLEDKGINDSTKENSQPEEKSNLSSMSDNRLPLASSRSPTKTNVAGNSSFRLLNAPSIKSNYTASLSHIDPSFSTANGFSRSIRMRGLSRKVLRMQAEDIVSGRCSKKSVCGGVKIDGKSHLDLVLVKNMAIGDSRDPGSWETDNDGREDSLTYKQQVSMQFPPLPVSSSTSRTPVQANCNDLASQNGKDTCTNKPDIVIEPKFMGENPVFRQAVTNSIHHTVTNSTIATTSIHEDQLDNVIITFSSGSHSEYDHSDNDYDDRDPRGSGRHNGVKYADENPRQNRWASFDPLPIALGAPSNIVIERDDQHAN